MDLSKVIKEQSLNFTINMSQNLQFKTDKKYLTVDPAKSHTEHTSIQTSFHLETVSIYFFNAMLDLLG